MLSSIEYISNACGTGVKIKELRRLAISDLCKLFKLIILNKC